MFESRRVNFFFLNLFFLHFFHLFLSFDVVFFLDYQNMKVNLITNYHQRELENNKPIERNLHQKDLEETILGHIIIETTVITVITITIMIIITEDHVIHLQVVEDTEENMFPDEDIILKITMTDHAIVVVDVIQVVKDKTHHPHFPHNMKHHVIIGNRVWVQIANLKYCFGYTLTKF